MPTNKDFKRLIRARMLKTGEAYTAARANLLRRPAASPTISAPAVTEPQLPSTDERRRVGSVAPLKIDFAKLAGMSDAAIKKATGCDWAKWAFCLDYVGAQDWSHRAIADYVHTTYKLKDWWAQSVTVGYERIKGLRAIGQRRDGGFEANRTKTVSAPAAAVFRAFAHARVRKHWLSGVSLAVRKVTPDRSLRMKWDDGTPVEVWLTAKGAKKTSVQVQHRKLSGQGDAEERKRYWGERLDALAEVIE